MDKSDANEKELFLEALGIDDVDRREAWIETACMGDDSLRSRVRRLVSSALEEDGFLEPDEGTLTEALGVAADESGVRVPAGETLSFGDYELLGEVARGAMGVVYRARQNRLQRVVALKMIRGHVLSSGSDVERFQREAAAAASLSHPNIVPIYEVGEAEGQHYFTMKLLEGGTLGDRMESLAGHSRQAASLMRTIADAVHAAHQRGILHRDLKPGNILLDEADKPYVTDFGLAKHLDAEQNLTLSGQIVGTPFYMAPEQAAGGSEALTIATDVYSLGAMLFEMLVGRPPFDGGTVMETLRQVREEAVPRLRKDGRVVDRDLETVVHKCLEKDPAQRYASAAALAEDLQRWLDDKPISARPSTPSERTLKWIQRRPFQAAFAAVASALILVLAVGGPLVAYRQQQLRIQAERAEAEFRLGLARSLEQAAPSSVPFILETLRQSADPEVMKVVQDRLDGAETGSVTRSRLAAALSVLGRPDWEELLASMGLAPVAEGQGLALAFEAHPEAARNRLREHFQQHALPRVRNRLACFLLSLGSVEEARLQLALGPDLATRVDFIREFPQWHGSLKAFPGLLQATEDADLRSGLCLALGGMLPERIPPDLKEAMAAALAACYREAPDGGTHAAAEWALRQLRLPRPDLEKSGAAPVDRDWFRNREGLKMVAVPPGVFFPEDYIRMEEDQLLPRHAVAITRRFHLSWGTISEMKYNKVISRAIKRGVLPENLKSLLKKPFREDMRPMAGVTLFYATLFCNALSGLEGLEPAYQLDLENQTFLWEPKANGYRLPTDAEWEYASRAGTQTRFLTGPTVEWLPDYAHIYHEKLSLGREARPSPLGLFNMVGNAWEMTVDRGLGREGLLLVNPVGEIGETCSLRGGPTHGGAYFYHASARTRADARRVQHSFRVALGPPGEALQTFPAEDLADLLGWPDRSLSAAETKILARQFELEGRSDQAEIVREGSAPAGAGN